MVKELVKSIKFITQDSRRVEPGALFFALRGGRTAKLKNLQDALTRGAFEVVHDLKGFKKGLYVESIDSVFTDALKELYKESFNKLKVYGVTGTNGKTTYSYMLKGLLESYSVPTGIFGTVENAFGENKLKTGLTSPLAEDFYSFSHEQYQNGMKALVCEVSSHSLDQKRMGLRFLDAAAFTKFFARSSRLPLYNEILFRGKVKNQVGSFKKKCLFLCKPFSDIEKCDRGCFKQG